MLGGNPCQQSDGVRERRLYLSIRFKCFSMTSCDDAEMVTLDMQKTQCFHLAASFFLPCLLSISVLVLSVLEWK